MSRNCGVILFVIFAVLGFYIYEKVKVPIPEVLKDKWWGSGQRSQENRTIVTGKLKIDDQIIADLKQRLQATKSFYPSLERVHQHYGINCKTLNHIFDYWKNHYNWTERLQYLNQYPHSFTYIRGLKIHFMHIKPRTNDKQLKVVPMLILHGWLGSFREFYEMIPKLTQPREDKQFVFELIIPSLPGFGFSEATNQPGLTTTYIAQIMADLMDTLGFNKYYVQGGDWGGSVVNFMAFYYPEKILGMHSNLCISRNFFLTQIIILLGRYVPTLVYNEGEAELCDSPGNNVNFLLQESGYYHMQATKPDTIGVALRESPMGLAAYMLEKFSTLTNPKYKDLDDAGLTKKFSMDQLLDNIMVYWITDSITSSMRIYAEAINNYRQEMSLINSMTIWVPSGCARFPNEILVTPRIVLERKFKNLVHLTKFDRGGHFAAFEEPQLFVDDLYMFVETVENIVG